MLLIFCIWYQLFDFQMLFWRDMKEISAVRFTMPHFYWCLSSRVLYICMLLPFLIYFHQISPYFKNSIAVFLMQILELTLIMFWVTEKSSSFLTGPICGVICFFLFMNEMIKGDVYMVITAVSSNDVNGQWFLIRGVIIGALLVPGVIGRIF